MQTTWTSSTLTFSYITLEDLIPIAEMLAKESVCRWLFFGPNTSEATYAYFLPFVDENSLARTEKRMPGHFVFTIRNRETGAFIGQCALLAEDFSPGAYLVGYQIDDPYCLVCLPHRRCLPSERRCRRRKPGLGACS